MISHAKATLLGILIVLSQVFPKPAFQVVSLKVNPNSGFSPTILRMTGNRFSTTGMPLRPLMMQFYDLRDFQIEGGPDWINIDQWDIEAVADDGANLNMVDFENPSSPTRGALMVQSLVEERFRLKTHRVTKELPVYELTVAKNGPKIKPLKDPKPSNRRSTRGEIDVEALPFATFRYLLSRQLDRVLVDKTNLTGLYDIKLKWNAEFKAGVEPASDRPSVFTAVQEQLGLKLENSKGPVEVLVVDSVQRPSEN